MKQEQGRNRKVAHHSHPHLLYSEGLGKSWLAFFLSLFLRYIHLPRTLTTLAIRDPLQPFPPPGSTLVIGKISHLLQAAWETTVGMNALGNSSIN